MTKRFIAMAFFLLFVTGCVKPSLSPKGDLLIASSVTSEWKKSLEGNGVKVLCETCVSTWSLRNPPPKGGGFSLFYR